MRKNLSLWVSLTFLTLVSVTNCTKVNSTIDGELSAQKIQTAIVGSWQFVEKGVEVAMHEGHICPDPQNMAQDKVTYVVQWKKIVSDEKRFFKPNGDYTTYLSTTLSCQGTYKIAESGVLETNTNCENTIGKIDNLPTTYLTIRQGINFFKYQKLD